MIANCENVDIFYLDFQKAFDTVPHYRLYLKLMTFGVQGKVLNTIFDFLSNRTCNLIVGDSKSNSFNVTSGVPQGCAWITVVSFQFFVHQCHQGVH